MESTRDDGSQKVIEALHSGASTIDQIHNHTQIAPYDLFLILADMLKSGQITCQKTEGIKHYKLE